MKTHQIRGAAIAGVSALALAMLMFLPRFLSFGFLLGLILLLLIVIGVWDGFGAIRIATWNPKANPNTKPSINPSSPFWLRVLSQFDVRWLYAGLGFLIASACRLSVLNTAGANPSLASPLILFGLGAGSTITAWIRRNRFDGDFHPGFFVMSISTAAIMTTLGSHGLWDCWETHYGEVARRQLEQDDWISLFWGNKWFYSKPILIFWLMNLGMLLFSVNVSPDQVSGHAEWGVRFFVAVISLWVIYGVYSLLARRVSKRAGLFSAIVLATMPMFGFMSRQAITDLPFVGFMTLGVVFFLLGVTANKEAKVENRAIPIGGGRALEFNGFHGIVAAYVLIGVPQFLYILTRHNAFISGTLGRGNLSVAHAKEHFVPALSNFHLSDLFDISTRVERWLGRDLVVGTDISLNWCLLGLTFLVPFAFILFSIRAERRVSKLCYHAMFICLALSVMAKGVAGLLMPVLGMVTYWLAIIPWSKVLRPSRFFEVWGRSTTALLSIFSRPSALYRISRGGFQMMLSLLRYPTMFLLLASPWYVAMYYRHGDPFIQRFFIHDHFKRMAAGVHGERGNFQYFLEQLGYGAFPWVVLLPFALFAWPSLFPKQEVRTPKEDADRTIRLFLTCLLLICFTLLSFMTTKFHHYAYPLLTPVAILVGLFLNDTWSGKITRLGQVVLIAGVGIVAIAKDLVADPDVTKGVAEGYAKLLGLFIYKYGRDYPSGGDYDFGLPILVFAALFAICFLGWLIKWRRRAAIVATLLVALGFGHFLFQHYMVALAPHWTQKHLIDEYYQRRQSKDERLVAFQMNWKGENFYTGNRVIVHVSTKNKNFDKWCDKHRGQRHFFITEYARFKNMSRRAKAKSGPLIPFKDTCNKYKAGFAEEL